MFCKNCGANLADSAMFCFNCGTKVEQEQPVVEQSMVSEPVLEQPVIEPISEVVEQIIYQSPVIEEPAYQQPAVEQAPSYHQPVFQQPVQPTVQPVYQQSVQTMYQQPIYHNKMPKEKGSKASVAAVVLGILAVLASVMISLSSFLGKEAGVGVENIVFAVSSILIIIYAVSNSTVSSIIKGVGLAAATVLHIIFFGVSAFKASFDIFGNAEAGIDYYYAVILLIELVLFYVYMLMNIIRSFINSKGASAIMLLFGYISALLMIAVFVIDYVSDTKGLFAFKFIPVDLGLVLMIIADIFAVIGRAKKQETK